MSSLALVMVFILGVIVGWIVCLISTSMDKGEVVDDPLGRQMR